MTVYEYKKMPMRPSGLELLLSLLLCSFIPIHCVASSRHIEVNTEVMYVYNLTTLRAHLHRATDTMCGMRG